LHKSPRVRKFISARFLKFLLGAQTSDCEPQKFFGTIPAFLLELAASTVDFS